MSNYEDATGGTAFPVTEENYAGKYGGEGMTLRDYFAAKAMQGLWASGRIYLDKQANRKEVAQIAYQIADEMLIARGRA